MAKKIKDFGEKIGGARKDMFRKDGLREDDIKRAKEYLKTVEKLYESEYV